MAKHSSKEKYYSEAELILTFGLSRVPNGNTDLMREWLNTPNVTFRNDEQILFDKILHEAQQKIEGWHEEALKMKFIAFVLALGQMEDGNDYNTYFEETISATVEGNYLKTKTDFMIAKGVLDLPIKPFFHFQAGGVPQWKRHKDPNGDPVAQLLEAFLIAQEINKNNKPLYGCTISGKYWDFFTIQDKTYCISKTYDCTDSIELLQIISILRKFKDILHTKLLD